MVLIVVVACTGPREEPGTVVTDAPAVSGRIFHDELFQDNVTNELDKNIRSIYQDVHNNFWFGTNDAGVYRYDGKILTRFTDKDGLCNNQVQSIQEDRQGNVWFGTGVFGVSRFDGKTFTTLNKEQGKQNSKEPGDYWKTKPDALWFYGGSGVYRYMDSSLSYLALDQPGINLQPGNSPYRLSPFAVYSILKDRQGNIWLGTQSQGVCRYDGKALTWFREEGLEGSAVLGLFEDSKGNIWAGNNGSGLFRYEGKRFVNFTEEKGLGNKAFKTKGKSGPGSLARIYAVNEDNDGNLWIGTVDAGVWRYDGSMLTNYTIADGLTSNAVNTIYKDRQGVLWFGTDSEGICKFEGRRFSEVVLK